MLDKAKALNSREETKGLDIGDILTAPLVAASNANGMMLREQTRFLMEYCFNLDDDGETLSPRLIPMKMTRSVIEPDPDGEGTITRQVSTIFNVPLLTVIPINTISVQSVTVDFEMEVTNQSTSKESSKSTLEKQSGGRDDLPKAKLYGKISYDSKDQNSKSSRSQNSSKLKVKINAGQLPLPLGMTTMLDMYSKSIHPISSPEKDK